MESGSVLDQWEHSCADAFPGVNDDSFAVFLSHSTPPVVGAAASPESLAFLLPPPRLESIAGERVQKKRKSRASKRSPIAYFTADPAHFRELVQRITGAHPAATAASPLDPPETARSFPLPTLDAASLSSFDPAGFLRPTLFGSDPVTSVDTVIEEIDDDIIVLPIKYDFTPFQDLGQHVDKKDAVVDIIGIVVEGFPVKAVSTKHGPTNVQKFLLIDDSIHSIMLSIWKDFLVNEGTILLNEVKKFPILIARRLRVSYFNGIELSTHFNSVLLVDPPIAEAMRLKNWVKKNRKMIQDYVIGKGTNQHTHNVTIPTDSNITLLANILPFQKVALIKAKINFKEIIQKYYYMACKKCFHATTAAYHYEYTCNFCNEKQLAEPRCRFEINLSDESGAITATLFGEMAEQILGLTATEAMKTPSKMHIDSVHSSLETKEYIIQIKPSKQKDKESQHKYSIVYCVEYKHVEKSSNLLTHPICESSGVLNSKEENLNIQEYATDVTLPLLSPDTEKATSLDVRTSLTEKFRFEDPAASDDDSEERNPKRRKA